MATSKKNKNSEFGEPEETTSAKNGTIDFSQTNSEGEKDTLNDDNVIMREGRKVTGDTSVLDKPITGAVHEEPTINLDEPGGGGQFDEGPLGGAAEEQGQGYSGGAGGGWKQPKQDANEPFNSEFSEMPDAEKEASAAQMVETVLYGYCQLKMAIASFIRISPRRIKKMHEAGEIDKFERVRLNPNSPETITLEEFVALFNDTLDKRYETTEDWKNAMRPLLLELFKRKGVGLTLEQQIGLLLIVDLVQLAKSTAVSIGERRDFIETLKLSRQQQAPPPSTPLTPDIRQEAPAQPQHQSSTQSSQVSDIIGTATKRTRSKKDTAQTV